VVAVVTQADLPDVRFGGFVQDRYLFAKDVVRFEGEIVAGVAALTERSRRGGAARSRSSTSPPGRLGLRRGDVA
jgi:xanthine dehydrogenase molybdopterin-binding subunit B